MTVLTKIRPKEPLKTLKWVDILIVTIIMFGEFIIQSTQQFLQSLQPVTEVAQQYTETTTSYSDGAAYSSNFTLQLILLAIALLYLVIRHYDFKQLKIRFHWSVLIWVPVLFTIVGLFGDVVTTLSGEYNYFDPALVPFMNPQEIINKFLALSPMAIAYGLLNGFYEEFFFLGLMTSVKEEHQWKALAFSTLVRFSFHTYQGMLWAIVIGVVYGLFYYFMYKKSGEKPITILPYSCIGRYVWFNVYLLINRMGILTLSQAHPRKGALFMFPHSSCGFLIVTITLQRCKSGSYTFEASNAEYGMVQLRVVHIQCESRYSYYKTARIRGNINAGFPVD